MLRKLIQDHQPQYIAASFDLAGPTFRDPTWRPTTKPTARRCRPISPSRSRWVHEACEAMGVPIITYERFEADDVIGTLARRAVAEGFEVAIVTGDKDFFQLVHDGLKRLQPAGRWHVVRRRRREGEVRRRAAPGHRRPGADGGLDRQRQGCSRHRREGRARSDCAATVRSTSCSRTRESAERRNTARACSRTRRMRGRAASWRASGPMCRSTFDAESLRYRGRRANAVTSSSAGSDSARSSWSTRRRADTIGKDYALVHTRDGMRELAPS